MNFDVDTILPFKYSYVICKSCFVFPTIVTTSIISINPYGDHGNAVHSPTTGGIKGEHTFFFSQEIKH